MLYLKILFRFEYRNADTTAIKGGALICPNHLSHLDPMLVGCVARRRISFLAKKDLFDNWFLGWYLKLLQCIPIDRESRGIGGMKETLRLLKKGESIVLYPEGERSPDGNLLPLMKGFTVLVKRVKVPIVPAGIHGTFEAWPRGATFPKLGRVKLVFGDPIPFSDIQELDDEQMTEYLSAKIAECYEQARQWNTQ